jgi:hypothetical protein
MSEIIGYGYFIAAAVWVLYALAERPEDVLRRIERRRLRRERWERLTDRKRCRYSDCRERHPLASDEQRVSCPTCRDWLGLA